MKKNITRIAAILAATSGLVTAAPAHAESDALQKFLIDDATPYVDVRYRFENVDQDGFADDANASTIRTKLGYKTGKLHGFSGVVEVENVARLGGEAYNDTVNGKTSRPVVADPDGTEINQAYLAYTGIDDTTVVLGRQAVNLDNQRHIGTVDWRQNDQTYDAVAVVNNSIPDTTLLYGYVANVNRTDGETNLHTSSHLFNAAYGGWDFGKLSAYAYLLDLDDAALASLDSNTYGLSFAGDVAVADNTKVLYSAEYARQTDSNDNPINYDADYYHLTAGTSISGIAAKVGYEVLGSDSGTASFQTALGTNHKFNGWADMFAGGTPANGLEDIYGSLGYTVSSGDVAGLKLLATYHDFSADEGSADYGKEIDAKISKDFMEHYNVTLQYADFNADSASVYADTRKMWLQLGAKF